MRRGMLLGAVALGAGAAAGAVLERVLYQRVLGDPELATEVVRALPGTPTTVSSFDGAELHVVASGPSDPLCTFVFAHGITENMAIWQLVLSDLAADGRWRLVSYDARGHGGSSAVRGPKGTTPLDGDTLARDLAAVVDQTTAGPVIGVGHSLGGMASLSLLTAGEIERSRYVGAVIVNSTFTAELAGWRGRGKGWQRTLERIGDVARRVAGDDARRIEKLRPRRNDAALLAARLWFGDTAPAAHVEAAFDMFDSTPSETLAAAFDLTTYDTYDLLCEIDVPVLLIAGARDFVTPAWLSREMAAVIGGSELVVFENCGHMAPFERHTEIAAHLRKFADRVLA